MLTRAFFQFFHRKDCKAVTAFAERLRYQMSLLILIGIIVAISWVWKNPHTKPPTINHVLPSTTTSNDIGNHPVLSFADDKGQTILSITVRELCSHMAIIGQSGSGKTTSICSLALETLVELGLPGVIFGVKPDDRLFVEALAKKCGRELTIIDRSETSARINFIEYLLNRPNAKGQVSSVVEVLFHLPQLVNPELRNAGAGEAFWQNSGRMLLNNGLNLIYLTGYPVTIEAISRVLTSIPRSEEDLSNGAFIQKSLCAQLLLVADAESDLLTHDQRHNLKSALHYFKEEYLSIPEVTRGSIEAVVKSILFYLNDGTISRLFCSESSFTPEECFIEGGRTVFVDLPTIVSQSNRFGLGLFREVMKQAIVSRDTKKHPAFMYLYADEYQELALPNDHEFFGVCRSQKVLNLIAFQTFDSLAIALGTGEGGRQKANIILGNCAVKCFLRSAYETSKWCADQIGREYKQLLSINSSTNSSTSTPNDGKQSGNSSDGKNSGYSISQQRDHIIFPENIMSLENGGEANNYTVSMYLLPGKFIIATNSNYLKVSLEQIFN